MSNSQQRDTASTQTALSPSATNDTSTAATSTGEAALKKRRGRPRKNVAVESVETVATSQVEATSDASLSTNADAAPKKRRGRPRKSPVSSESQDAPLMAAIELGSQDKSALVHPNQEQSVKTRQSAVQGNIQVPAALAAGLMSQQKLFGAKEQASQEYSGLTPDQALSQVPSSGPNPFEAQDSEFSTSASWDEDAVPEMPDYMREEESHLSFDPSLVEAYAPDAEQYVNPSYVNPNQASLADKTDKSGQSGKTGQSGQTSKARGFDLGALAGFMPHTVGPATDAPSAASSSFASKLSSTSSSVAASSAAAAAHSGLDGERAFERSRGNEFRSTAEALQSWQSTSNTYAAPFVSQPVAKPDEEPVYDAAMLARIMPPINLAYVQFLMKHYPMSTPELQSAMNVLLLCLFAKMQDGHICITLDSVVSLFYVLKEWIEPRCQQLEREAKQAFFYAPPKDPDHIEPEDLLYLQMQENVPKTSVALTKLLTTSPAITQDASNELPLVWDLDRLYVRRYFLYEQRIAAYIHNMQFRLPENEALTKALIDLLFPPEKDAMLPGGLNWQKVAALMSTTSNFTVISGGPGTGKTTTVFKLLLLLLCLSDQNRQILMCAPTAKAAARMGESISNQLKDENTEALILKLCEISGADAEQIKSILPRQAETVHRLLKVRPHMVTPIYNAHNKLNCDVLIVDEVSMLEMSLFAKLVDALPENCRLILLGDKDQLSSVGAGMVLGDICSILNSKDPRRIRPEILAYLSRLSGYSEAQLLQGKIANHIALLQYSWRSKDVPEIIELATIFNETQTINAQRNRLFAGAELQSEAVGDQVMQQVIYGDEQEHFSDEYKSYCDLQLARIKDKCLIAHDITEPKNDSASPENAAGANDAEANAAGANSNANGSEFKLVFKDGKNQFQAPLVLHILMDPLDMSQPLPPEVVKKLSENGSMTGNSWWSMSAISSRLKMDDAVRKEQQRILEQHKVELERKKKEQQTSLIFLRHSLVKSWVDPRGKDNYAPFLKMLQEMDFKVNPESKECENLFKAMDKFRVLCSNHSDWFGDRSLNNCIEDEVLKTYVNKQGRNFTRGEFFPGQIVLITANDPLLNLVNGSVGFCAYVDESNIADSHNFTQYVQRTAARLAQQQQKGQPQLSDEQQQSQQTLPQQPHKLASSASTQGQFKGSASDDGSNQQLKVFIPMGEKDGCTQVNVISTLLLNHYETGYAMSIHKSQGSEYEHVAIVLSQRVNPILTKELVYTGITRAKKRVDLIASEGSLKYALSHAVIRESGLEKRLYPDYDLSGDIKISSD